MIKVTSFYKFFNLTQKELSQFKTKLKKQGQILNIKGLVLLGNEGINATLCGEAHFIEQYKIYLNQLFNQNFSYNDSSCKKWNFKLLSVKVKPEIVTIGQSYPHLKNYNTHLTPQEWQSKLKTSPQIVDVRNTYEVCIGKFKQAQNLQMESFKEFPEKIVNLKLDKTKDTLIYCTGGIRCEKAAEIMKHKGFKKIYQLKGGIISYLKKYPNLDFQGECFVFDHRVAVDQNLKPSQKYSLCPHCGQPGSIDIVCNHCEKPAQVCSCCLNQKSYNKTCSKNCAYHFKLGHKCYKKFTKTDDHITNTNERRS